MPAPVIHCVYASTSGNVEIVAETVAKVLQGQELPVELHRAEQTAIDLIQNNQNFLFATSTWERGTLNPFFVPLLEEMKKIDFTGKKAGFIGLGDIRYENVFFNRGIDLIHDAWKANRGEVLFRLLKLNGDPYAQLDSVVTPWAQAIGPLFPEAHG
jgi:flavodoxin